MKINQFLIQTRKYKKPFYRLVDFEKIFNEDKITIQKSISRFISQGLLVRLQKDVYILPDSSIDYIQIANLLYYPSYVSFESVLFKYGVINQPPFGATFATTRQSKKIKLGNQEFWYSKIKHNLWWGFKKQGNILIASLEKAIVDMLYLKKRGKRMFSANEWHTTVINKPKLNQFLLKANLKKDLINTQVRF